MMMTMMMMMMTGYRPQVVVESLCVGQETFVLRVVNNPRLILGRNGSRGAGDRWSYSVQ